MDISKIVYHVKIYDSQTKASHLVWTFRSSETSLKEAKRLKHMVDEVLTIVNAPRSFTSVLQPEQQE